MDLELTDRVYIVTGGARGLGRATVDVLAAEGARVVVSGRSQEAVDATVGELNERHQRDVAVGVAGDNSDPTTPQRLLGAADLAWGRIDGALISVGGPPKASVTAASDSQWREAFESVFLGAVRLAREIGVVLPHGGALALVLSSSVKAPLPEMAISNGLRPGLAMVAKTLSNELGPAGVRVNGLLPGRLGTDRVAELDALAEDPGAARAAHEKSIALGRYGEPEEFGRVAAFLLSPAASYLTGVMLPVDGGLLDAL
ncbi:MAG: SDR family oxidoreductase [Nocardioides sp.]|nr:SDR family oxidoreductase [Nocardioides sp.]